MQLQQMIHYLINQDEGEANVKILINVTKNRDGYGMVMAISIRMLSTWKCGELAGK